MKKLGFILIILALLASACDLYIGAPREPGIPPQGQPEPGQYQPGQGEPQPGQPQPGEPQPGQPPPGEPPPGEPPPGEPPPGEPPPGEPPPGGQPPVDGVGESPLHPVLINQQVMVPGGGGFAEVTFWVSNEQSLEIILEGSNPGMQPYGSLQYPDGRTEDNPPITSAGSGTNRVVIQINQQGQYTLTIFDGSNAGGSVMVIVTGNP